jgi:hypothetical protein
VAVEQLHPDMLFQGQSASVKLSEREEILLTAIRLTRAVLIREPVDLVTPMMYRHYFAEHTLK